MATLTAPYNFAPISKKVVRPFWADQISHDKPFSDGLSGELQLKIVAKTPIFTRNSVSRRVTNEEQRKELGSHFSKFGNEYYLPGSSIKGAIRNVLEILSFGDFAAGLVDKPYAMRDLTLDNYKEMFSATGGLKVYCGWLKQEGVDSYFIEDCGFPSRIAHAEIDKNYRMPIMKNWVQQFEKVTKEKNNKANGFNINKGQASIKRALFNGKPNLTTFTLNDGTVINGTLVLTGQPSLKYNNVSGKGTIDVNHGESIKYKEFIFGKAISELFLKPEVVEAFEFAYGSLQGIRQLNEPVFFHKNEKNQIVSFGLAYMYKIPFKYSVRSTVERIQGKSDIPDLSGCIFGHLQEVGLKGRVIFGHAWAKNSPIAQPNSISEVLNSPKATYFPTYVEQKTNSNGLVPNYSTFFDNNANPAGWKRFPIHSDGIKRNSGPINPKTGEENKKIQTAFRPLPAGTTFNCSIHYHNLKPIELGAILSALTFHNSSDCFHNLGMAKPLGYGQCEIVVNGITEQEKIAYLKAFESFMEVELEQYGGWSKSSSVTELLTMSSLQDNSDDRSKLEYMKEVKDFASVKRDGQALARYSKLPKIKTKNLVPLCSSEDIAKAKEVIPQKASSGKNLKEVFDIQKASLIKELELKKAKLIKEAVELQEKNRKEAEELVRQKQAKDAEFARNISEKEKGINLNAVTDRKSIEVLLRSIKYYTEKLKGDIGPNEIEIICAKFSNIYASFKKEKDKTEWLIKCLSDVRKLEEILSSDQLKQVEGHLNLLK